MIKPYIPQYFEERFYGKGYTDDDLEPNGVKRWDRLLKAMRRHIIKIEKWRVIIMKKDIS